MVGTTGSRSKRARASEVMDQDGESNVDGANLALGETVPAAPRAIMTPGDVRAKVQPANPSSNGQPQQTTTSSGPENVSNKTPVVPSSGVSGRLKQLLDEELSRVRDHGFKDHSTCQVSITTGDASTVPTHAPQQQTAFGNVRGTYPQVSQPSNKPQHLSLTRTSVLTAVLTAVVPAFFFTSPKAGTEVKEDSLSRSKLEEEQEITSAEPVDRYMNLADKPFLETSLCHPHNAQPSQSQLDPIASSYSFDGTGLGSPTPTPIGLLLEAYNPSALKERGYLHIREELDRQNRQERTAITDLEQLLPSPELRELALEDIRARLERRFRPGDLPRTLRGAIKLKSMGAECWIEWGKEKGIDYSGHEQRLRGLKYIDKMLGPEKTSDGLLPPSGDGSGLLRGPSYTDDGLTPRNEIMRRIPLHLEQMDLTMILCTDNKDECHWCQGEQCWGIPGGVRFKKEAYEADKADGADKTDETDEANTQPSVMCRDCGNQRYLIGTHAFHGSWKSLPAPSSPPTHAKSYMRQTTCAVCTGLATSICGGCPLRACVNCQVSLDVFCQGNMDRLLNSYGEAGRRNDARLMGSSLAWAAWQRAMRAAAVS